jgi:hypothetical protein
VCGGVVSAAGSQKRHLTRKRNASSLRLSENSSRGERSPNLTWHAL